MDPRDKVYITLSFQTDVHSLTADYALSTDQIYGGLVKSYIDSKRGLDILGHCRSANIVIGDMPCWIPDWRAEHERVSFTKHADGKEFTARQRRRSA